MELADTPWVLPSGQLPAAATQSGDDVDLSSVRGPRQHLNQDAHRRWKASTAVDFLNNVKHIDIPEVHTKEDRVVLYALEVNLSRPMSVPGHCPPFVVERRFSDFEDLRNSVWSAVSATPPCTCQYCLDLLVYIRFKVDQPRGLIKLTAGTEKRRRILVQFTSDLVAMGRRRAEKAGKRECQAQLAIPVLLEEFLVGVGKNG
ncbi:hypothetical protein PRNP1_015343 [Phytophthora ramorum]